MAIHGAAWHSAFPKTLFKLFECVWVLFYSICSALCPHLLHLTFCDSRFITKIPVWNCHSCLTWGLIQNLKSIVLTFRSIAAYQTRRTRTYTHGCLRAVHFARSVDNLLSSAHDQSQSRNIVFYLVFFQQNLSKCQLQFPRWMGGKPFGFFSVKHILWMHFISMNAKKSSIAACEYIPHVD